MIRPYLLMRLLAIGVLLGSLGPVEAAAERPMEVLRAKVSEGLAILNDPRYRTPEARVVQGNRIWALSRETFDFTIMSRMVLASRWQSFTPEQQTAFVEAFAAFLRRAYLPDLLEQYNGERLEYMREVMVSATRARVDVLVHWRDRKIPATAKMIRRDGTWKIYDVSALGISAMQNYRAQFQWLLRQETPARIIEILNRSHGRSVDG